MLRSLLGKSSSRSATSKSKSDRHRRRDRDERSTTSSSRHKAKSTHNSSTPSSSGRKSARGDDRGLDVDPALSTYSSSSRRYHPESAAKSTVSSSYVTADPGDPADDAYDGGEERPEYKYGGGEMGGPHEIYREERSLRSHARRQERHARNESYERLRSRESDGEREERRRRRREREALERMDEHPEEPRRHRGRTESGDGSEERPLYSSSRAAPDSIEPHIAESSSPRAETFTTPTSIPDAHPSSRPADPAPPPAKYGLAAEYYNDQGQSVSTQPGVRPESPVPPIVAGAQPHLTSSLTTPAPPVEPSTVGQNGAASPFYDITSTQANESHPIIDVTAPLGMPPKPESTPSTVSQPTYGIDPALLTDHDQGQPPAHGTPIGQAQSFTNGQQQHQYTSSSHQGMAALGAGAGVASASGLAYNVAHKPHHFAHAQYQPGSFEYHRERHGPLRRFIDFWKDPEGVAQFEEYSEIIGVCKYCFEPGTTSKDAPRKHNHRRRYSYEPPSNRARVDKHSRYASSDDESRRKRSNRRSWLAGALASYVGKSLYDKTRSSFGGSSAMLRESPSPTSLSITQSISSSEAKGRTSLGVAKSSNRSYSTSLPEDTFTEFRGGNGTYRLPSEIFSPPKSRVSKQHRQSESGTSSSERGPSSILTEAAPGTSIAAAASSSSGAARKARSGSHRESRRRRYSTSSSSGFLVDISRPSGRSGLAGLSYFFTAPSEKRPKEKSKKPRTKKRGFFGFRSVSSSSSDDADLAFGTGFYKVPSRKSRTRRQDEDLDTKLFDLESTAVSLASAASRMSGRRRSDVAAGKAARRRSPGGRAKSQYTSSDNPLDDEEWESMSSSESSLDSALAYGDSSDSGTSRWGWRWVKRRREKSKASGSTTGRPGPTVIEGAPTESDTGLSSMHKVHPITTSDPFRFDAASGSLISSSTPGHSREPLYASHAEPINIDQPQPIAPISQNIYQRAETIPAQTTPVIHPKFNTVSLSRHDSASSVAEPSNEPLDSYRNRRKDYDERHSKTSRKENGHQRRDSSPLDPIKRPDSPESRQHKRSTSQVQFDLTDEQAEKELRLQKLEEEKRATRKDRVSRPSSDYGSFKPESSSRRDTQPTYVEIRPKDYDEYSDKQSDYSPSTTVGATIVGAAATSTILNELDDERSDKRREARREKRRDERRGYTGSDEDNRTTSMVDQKQYGSGDEDESVRRARRIARKASKRIVSSPVYESYVDYFTPEEVRPTKGSPRSDASSEHYSVKYSPKIRFDREIAKMSEGVDTSRLPWPVPRLNLIEPTPPHSASGSVILEDDKSHGPSEEPAPSSPVIDDFSDSRSVSREVEDIQDPVATKEDRKTDSDHILGLGINADSVSVDEVAQTPMQERSTRDGISETPEVENIEDEGDDSARLSEAIASQQMPGGFDDDIEFVATVSACAKMAGFDPSIVTDDPIYYSRNSPSGSQSEEIPFRAILDDIDDPFTEGSTRPFRGFVEAESLPPSDTEEDKALAQKSSSQDDTKDDGPKDERPQEKPRDSARNEPASAKDLQQHQCSEYPQPEVNYRGESREFFDAEEGPVQIVDKDGGMKPTNHEHTNQHKRSSEGPGPKFQPSENLERDQVMGGKAGDSTLRDNFNQSEEDAEPISKKSRRKSRSKKKSGIDANDLDAGPSIPHARDDERQEIVEATSAELKPEDDPLADDPVSTAASRDIEFVSQLQEENPREHSVPSHISLSKGKRKKGKRKSSGFSALEEMPTSSEYPEGLIVNPTEVDSKQGAFLTDLDRDKGASLLSEHQDQDQMVPSSQKQKRKDRKKDRRSRYEEIVDSGKRAETKTDSTATEPTARGDAFTYNQDSIPKPFLEGSPEIPSNDATSGTGKGYQPTDPQIEPTTPVASIFGQRVRSRSSSPFPSQRFELPPHSRSRPVSPAASRPRRISVRGDPDVNPLATPSPTAIPLHFRRPVSCHGSPTAGSEIAPSVSPTATKAHKRPKSTEFKTDRELRPLWLVERHSSARTEQAPEGPYPSLPSSRTTSRTPSMEDLRTHNEPLFAYDQPLLSPRRQPMSLHVDTSQAPQNEDVLDSKQATPTVDTFQQVQKRDKLKYEFHSPSELLMEPFDVAVNRLPPFPPFPSSVPFLDPDLPPLPDSAPPSPITEAESWHTPGDRSSISAQSDSTVIPDFNYEFPVPVDDVQGPESVSRPSTALSAYESAAEHEEPGDHTPVPASPVSTIRAPLEEHPIELVHMDPAAQDPSEEALTGIEAQAERGIPESPSEDKFEEAHSVLGQEDETQRDPGFPGSVKSIDAGRTPSAPPEEAKEHISLPTVDGSAMPDSKDDLERATSHLKDTVPGREPTQSAEVALAQPPDFSQIDSVNEADENPDIAEPLATDATSEPSIPTRIVEMEAPAVDGTNLPESRETAFHEKPEEKVDAALPMVLEEQEQVLASQEANEFEIPAHPDNHPIVESVESSVKVEMVDISTLSESGEYGVLEPEGGKFLSDDALVDSIPGDAPPVSTEPFTLTQDNASSGNLNVNDEATEKNDNFFILSTKSRKGKKGKKKNRGPNPVFENSQEEAALSGKNIVEDEPADTGADELKGIPLNDTQSTLDNVQLATNDPGPALEETTKSGPPDFIPVPKKKGKKGKAKGKGRGNQPGTTEPQLVNVGVPEKPVEELTPLPSLSPRDDAPEDNSGVTLRDALVSSPPATSEPQEEIDPASKQEVGESLATESSPIDGKGAQGEEQGEILHDNAEQVVEPQDPSQHDNQVLAEPPAQEQAAVMDAPIENAADTFNPQIEDAEKPHNREILVEESPAEEKVAAGPHEESLAEQPHPEGSDLQTPEDSPPANIATEPTEATDIDFAPILSKKEKKKKRKSKQIPAANVPTPHNAGDKDGKPSEIDSVQRSDPEKPTDGDVAVDNTAQGTIEATMATETDFAPTLSKKEKRKNRKDKKVADEVPSEDKSPEEQEVKSPETETVLEFCRASETDASNENVPGGPADAVEASETSFESAATKKAKKKSKGKPPLADALQNEPELMELDMKKPDAEATAEAMEEPSIDPCAPLTDPISEQPLSEPVEVDEVEPDPVVTTSDLSAEASALPPAKIVKDDDKSALDVADPPEAATEQPDNEDGSSSIDAAISGSTEVHQADHGASLTKRGKKKKGKGKHTVTSNDLADKDTQQPNDVPSDMPLAPTDKVKAPQPETDPLSTNDDTTLPAEKLTEVSFTPIARKKSKKGKGKGKFHVADVVEKPVEPVKLELVNEAEISAEAPEEDKPATADIQDEQSSTHKLFPGEKSPRLESAQLLIPEEGQGLSLKSLEVAEIPVPEAAKDSDSTSQQLQNPASSDVLNDPETNKEDQALIEPSATSLASQDGEIIKPTELVTNDPSIESTEPCSMHEHELPMSGHPNSDKPDILPTSEVPAGVAQDSDTKVLLEHPSVPEPSPDETPTPFELQELQETLAESVDPDTVPKETYPSLVDSDSPRATEMGDIDGNWNQPKSKKGKKGKRKSRTSTLTVLPEIEEAGQSEPASLANDPSAADVAEVHLTQDEPGPSPIEPKHAQLLPDELGPDTEAAKSANETQPHVPSLDNENADLDAWSTTKPSKKQSRKDKKKQKTRAAAQALPLTKDDAPLETPEVPTEAKQGDNVPDSGAEKPGESGFQGPDQIHTELIEDLSVENVQPTSSKPVDGPEHENLSLEQEAEPDLAGSEYLVKTNEDHPAQSAVQAGGFPAGSREVDVLDREVEQTERGDAAHPFEEAKPGKKGKKDKKPESVSWEEGELPTEIPPANAETSQQTLAVDVAEGESTGKEPEFEEPKSTKSKRKAKKEKRKQRESVAWEEAVPFLEPVDKTEPAQAEIDGTEEPETNVPSAIKPDFEEPKSSKAKRKAKKEQKKRELDLSEAPLATEKPAEGAGPEKPCDPENEHGNAEEGKAPEIPEVGTENHMLEESRGEGLKMGEDVEVEAGDAVDKPEADDGKEFQSSKKKKRKSKRNAKTTDWTDEIPREQVVTEPADRDPLRSSVADVSKEHVVPAPDVQNEIENSPIAPDSTVAHESPDVPPENLSNIADSFVPSSTPQQAGAMVLDVSEVPLLESPPNLQQNSPREPTLSTTIEDIPLAHITEIPLEDLEAAPPKSSSSPKPIPLTEDSTTSEKQEQDNALATEATATMLETQIHDTENQDSAGVNIIPEYSSGMADHQQTNRRERAAEMEPFTTARSPEVPIVSNEDKSLDSIFGEVPEPRAAEQLSEIEPGISKLVTPENALAEDHSQPKCEESLGKTGIPEHASEERDMNSQEKGITLEEDVGLSQIEHPSQTAPLSNEETKDNIRLGEPTNPKRKEHKKTKKDFNPEGTIVLSKSPVTPSEVAATTHHPTKLSEELDPASLESFARPLSKKEKRAKRRKGTDVGTEIPEGRVWKNEQLSESTKPIDTHSLPIIEATDETPQDIVPGIPSAKDLTGPQEKPITHFPSLRTEPSQETGLLKTDPVYMQPGSRENPETDQPEEDNIPEPQMLVTGTQREDSTNIIAQPNEEADPGIQVLPAIAYSQPAEQPISEVPASSTIPEGFTPHIEVGESHGLPVFENLDQYAATPGADIEIKGMINPSNPPENQRLEDLEVLAKERNTVVRDGVTDQPPPYKTFKKKRKKKVQEHVKDGEILEKEPEFDGISAGTEGPSQMSRSPEEAEGIKENTTEYPIDDERDTPILDEQTVRYMEEETSASPEAEAPMVEKHIAIKTREHFQRDDDSLPSIDWNNPNQGVSNKPPVENRKQLTRQLAINPVGTEAYESSSVSETLYSVRGKTERKRKSNKGKQKQQHLDRNPASEELKVLASTDDKLAPEITKSAVTPDLPLAPKEQLQEDKVTEEPPSKRGTSPSPNREVGSEDVADSACHHDLAHEQPISQFGESVNTISTQTAAGTVASVFPHLERVSRKKGSHKTLAGRSGKTDISESARPIEDGRRQGDYRTKVNKYDGKPENEWRKQEKLQTPELSSNQRSISSERSPQPIRDEDDVAGPTLQPSVSLFGGPYGLGERPRAVSPPKTPLATIREQVPTDSPSYTRHRDSSDVGSPERGVKLARLDRKLSPVPTQSVVNKLNIERRRVPHESPSPTPKPALRSLSGPYDNILKTPETSEVVRRASIVSLESLKSADSLRLRRSPGSGDLRAQSKREPSARKNKSPTAQPEEDDVNIEALPSSSTYDPVTDKGKLPLRGMAADVYEGWGDVPGSPLSPSRPPSVRRRRSLQHLQDLETRLDQLVSENRLLSSAKATTEKALETLTITQRQQAKALETRDREIQDKDSEINQLKKSTQWLKRELARLTELNESLAATNAKLLSSQENETNQHNEVAQQWQRSREELEDLRAKYTQLSAGMESIVSSEVDTALALKNAEIRRLQGDLLEAQDKIKELQEKIVSSSHDNIIIFRDEDYFESACQKLCHHVQQWVLRFSKFSDMRLCRLTSTLRDEKVADRFENSILDGSDVDSYLADRVKRRDVFMSVVMTMMWDYIFTRYLFGMDREQRQKLKTLEKQLCEVGPPAAVQRWRATTLSLLSKRRSFQEQRALDTEAVVQEIYRTLSKLLPPPQELEKSILDSLRKVMRAAVNLSIEMRTQKAEYIMLPPLRPEYDTNGDLTRKVHFNANLMNERSGETTSNEELEVQQAVVRIVLFPLVVKKGSDEGEGDEEIVVCPAQVLVARPGKDKKVVRVLSGDRLSANPVSQSIQSFPSIDMDTSNLI
ncbi:hypothetical protein D8B26_002238 [Coccidioides posadasii str. Silveira]|uniref:uncharacterized protein n=1 Tax=Coccidioides posadasii (strain RMSCC 757 / Silveira) TaxID=443226 RepID=UPI001BEF589B|nr:hypothetical protein D8B26_002238 [Coccidioides posadasii str. Silveira]